MELEKLNFGENTNFKIDFRDNQYFIFDIIRKKQVLLTPEEWVRQHFIHFLIHEKKISKSAIMVEKKIILNRQIKRVDMVVYNQLIPDILIECKAPNIPLNKEVFNQTARYNSILECPKIMITNGIQLISFSFDKINNIYRPTEKLF